MKRGWLVIFDLLFVGNFVACLAYPVYYLLYGKWPGVSLFTLMGSISVVSIIVGALLVVIEKYERR